ncbi:hypothetical protein [Enterovibrio coralii]|uniref:Uncharacterized protein n=1 Tax=Enterovibrio coralii TaxID=294935 RepID=A0A135I5I8_9GAMM|nr:hypothetical protein [Enterovibrio coralii]KXF80701.1 hypothetical protein ATN88_08695 [Enterovibrio coralii]
MALSSVSSPTEELISIVDSVKKLRQCGLEPKDVVIEYLEKEEPNARSQAFSLITALALEQQVITKDDFGKSVSLFWNPSSQDILKYEPSKEISISLHRAIGSQITANYTTNEFITYLLQALEMTSQDFVAEDLPDSALLFHAVGILAQSQSNVLNAHILKGAINIVMSEMEPVLIDEYSQPIFLEDHQQSTH